MGRLTEGALNLNVAGRRVAGPLQGFGQMWEKQYCIRLAGATESPAEVIAAWKANFPHFWPQGALSPRFYAPLTGIAPGEVALINMGSGVRYSTGVMVLYADDESFTYMTPEGHLFAGWITFSAYQDEGGVGAQIRLLIRAGDPLYELAFLLGGNQQEDRFWEETLRRLAAHFGVRGEPQTRVTCVDPKRQWAYARNIRHNAALGSLKYALAAPLRWVRAAPKQPSQH